MGAVAGLPALSGGGVIVARSILVQAVLGLTLQVKEAVRKDWRQYRCFS